MTWTTVFTQQQGSIAMAIKIEGIPEMFTTNTETWTGSEIAGLTQIKGVLSTKGLQWGAKIDPKTFKLTHPGITFRLIDADFDTAPGQKQKLTDILFRTRAVNRTTLAADVTVAEAVTITVDDTAGFASSGDIYLDLETIGHTTTTGTTFNGALTRGKYGSKAVAHEFADAAGDDEAVPEGIAIAEITDEAVSWFGRRVTLMISEIQSDGVLTNAEVIWRGRFQGSLSLSGDGAAWEIPAESLWSMLDTTILGPQPVSTLRGITIGEDEVIEWRTPDNEDEVTFPGASFPTMTAFLNQLMETINDDTGASGGLGDNADVRRVVFHEEEGYIRAAIRTDGIAAGGRDTRLRFGPSIGGIFGDQQEIVITADFDGWVREFQTVGVSLRAYAFVTKHDDIVLNVESADSFDVVSLDVNARSVVNIDDIWFWLISRDTGVDQLTIQYLHDFHLNDRGRLATDGVYLAIRQFYDEAPIQVKEGIWLNGEFPDVWKDGFIENTDILEEWKGGLDTDDFDWDAIADAISGGRTAERNRVISGPTSFRKMFEEDLRWSLLAPTVRGSLIGAIPIAPPSALDSILTVNTDVAEAEKIHKFVRSRERVVNQLRFMPKTKSSEDLTITINDRVSQQRYRFTNSLEIKTDGAGLIDAHDVASLASQSLSYFQLFAYDNPILVMPCTIRAAGVEVGDAVKVTHYLTPDESSSTRGITNELMWVIGVLVKPWTASVELELIWIVDAVKRSGYAPAARCDAFTDNGGGAGDSQFEITVETGNYAAAAKLEGLFFESGMRVEFRERNTITPLVESNTVSPAASTATTVFVTAAPSGAMQALINSNDAYITLDDYDTVGQTAAGQDFLHVADDADNDIGTTKDEGFKPA